MVRIINEATKPEALVSIESKLNSKLPSDWKAKYNKDRDCVDVFKITEDSDILVYQVYAHENEKLTGQIAYKSDTDTLQNLISRYPANTKATVKVKTNKGSKRDFTDSILDVKKVSDVRAGQSIQDIIDSVVEI